MNDRQYQRRRVLHLFREAGAGRWVTIGAKESEGKRKGGVPVYIENGRITKGPAGMVGNRIGAKKMEASGVSVRKQAQEEYEKRQKYTQHGDKARDAWESENADTLSGIDPDSLSDWIAGEYSTGYGKIIREKLRGLQPGDPEFTRMLWASAATRSRRDGQDINKHLADAFGEAGEGLSLDDSAVDRAVNRDEYEQGVAALEAGQWTEKEFEEYFGMPAPQHTYADNDSEKGKQYRRFIREYLDMVAMGLKKPVADVTEEELQDEFREWSENQ